MFVCQLVFGICEKVDLFKYKKEALWLFVRHLYLVFRLLIVRESQILEEFLRNYLFFSDQKYYISVEME